MIFYLIVISRMTPKGRQTHIPLVTVDLVRAMDLAKKPNELCFPFDTEGDEIQIHKMENGVILPRSVLEHKNYIKHPIIFRRTKDRDLEWVDEWVNKTEEENFKAMA